MRKTLTLDEDVAAKLKALCHGTGESLRTVVNRVLRAGLYALRSPTPEDAFRLQARRLGLRAGLSLDGVAGLLEQVDGTQHRVRGDRPRA